MQKHFIPIKIDLTATLFRFFAIILILIILMAQGGLPNVLAQTGIPQLILTKSVEDNITTADVGDVIRYRIRFECSSLTGPCGALEIMDVLQPGLIYLPPPQSSVPAGFTIGYEPATRTVTITKDETFLDGSQYDAVIAVQVDYDLRPLPANINNHVTGHIDPEADDSWLPDVEAYSPTIQIQPVTADWTMTKTLYSPSINPTVDTDVTYRLQLCPTTNSGNVPLSNVVFTDTLPTDAVFVSASNSGTESGGVVTWPNIAGPVYPPNCITRYVTIQYPSTIDPGTGLPIFTIGDPVINTTSADGEYPDSFGTVGPIGDIANFIEHPIDPIHETPTYSKNDTGDPIGITGTGRFTLNLNTTSTNYPSSDAILIDNLPHELEVLQVTSGTWGAAFEHVAAYVEYSTDLGTTYTEFPGQPITYNTNATFAAPAANITNVRWRFVYDPDGAAPFVYSEDGLPYSWSFSTSPQIRITPRSVAAPADDALFTSLPAASAGETYDNCLQVSRTDSEGDPTLDPCNIEPMTVEGNIASIRVSKAETPGTGWDDLDDPNIDTFTADTAILPGDTVRYVISVELTERSSAALINPTIRDILPADLIFVRNGTARLDGATLPVQPTFTQSETDLTWEWNSPSPALTISPLTYGSHTLTVEFFARVQRGQVPGTYSNDLIVMTDSDDVVCEIPTRIHDTGDIDNNGTIDISPDIDNDGNTAEYGCRNPDTYVVERSAALRGEKWVRATDTDNAEVVDITTFLPDASCPDGGSAGLAVSSNPFTRYPCIAQVVPDGALDPGQFVPPPNKTTLDDFEYNLRIFNDGNVAMLEYVLYDILPYTGDTGSGGTLSGAARLSEFRPVMNGPVEFISGPAGLSSANFTIEYNETTNPCRPEVFNEAVGTTIPTGCNDTWYLEGAVTDWSEIRSYRIRLNNDGTTETPYIAPTSGADEVRFGVPMYIPKDSPVVGTFDADDAVAHEIAWNSFSHVGSYDNDPASGSANIDIRDLLASEPRKVGVTLPEVLSVGNRVWRDSDNSGTINPPDDENPGIENVVVYLYRDHNDDGTADGAVIATTLTDDGGYYLFSNIPYDRADNDNNRFIIGVPSENFNFGNPLYLLRSSSGTPPSTTYTTPTANTVDKADDGIDVTPGNEVFSPSFMLLPGTEPIAEEDLSGNERDGPVDRRRGVNGEIDENSDLTIDFGFFGGTDVPFSIGNHVWYDNGDGAGGILNDGIRQAGEPPVGNVIVRLYRDGNNDGQLQAQELIQYDVTDEKGFYLFDNLDPGPYYVEIPASEFADHEPNSPLEGWYSSQTTGTETVGVPGNTNTPNMDSDDNGVDTDTPEADGVFSGVIILERGVDETLLETHISAEVDPDSPDNAVLDPTGWDGPDSRGRFTETDETSNLTVDFGFIPPMSLGNRVWIDEGAGTTPFRTGYNNGLQDGTEVGVNGVRVELWRDTNGTLGLQVVGDTFIRYTTTDSDGYYLFDRLQPGDDYFVHIPSSNFTSGQPLYRYVSSYDSNQTTAPADDAEDMDDNGIDNATPISNGISSSQILMAYDSEPETPADETDINNSGTYGPNNVGLFGQTDTNSNLTMDFGFVRPPRSLGNYLWFDTNNDGQVSGGEGPVPDDVVVSLYLDEDQNGEPDSLVYFDETENGYYLFDNLPPNHYIVGVDRSNFASGGLLEGYNSSTGYVDNASNNLDSLDNGVDRLDLSNATASPYGILSTTINLTATPLNAPTDEALSGNTDTTTGYNPTQGDGSGSIGRNGETDLNSDLTIDFGFFQPMSLGNRVFLDSGEGIGGFYNDGIMNGTETGIAGVNVELYRDADSDGVPDGAVIRTDVTDANGFYLFDNIPEGSYVVMLPLSNFASGTLVGLNSSTPTGTENLGIPGNPYTPDTDQDDNGINAIHPETSGILSGTIELVVDGEPAGESELSGESITGTPLSYNPTGWDGPYSRGRFDESDDSSNLTVDFGLIPVFALGNRVWFDTDNSSTINGSEVGIYHVDVELWKSDGLTEILVGPDGILGSGDDASGGMLTDIDGYYLFNNLPSGDYIVVLPASNFDEVSLSHPLVGYWSSSTSRDMAENITEAAASDSETNTDSDDNGMMQGSGRFPGAVIASVVTLGPAIDTEPAGESDLDGGNQGQPDTQANMTVDFGFYHMQIGNQVWLDSDNSGLLDGSETGFDNVAVQLRSGDGSNLLDSTITSGGGYCVFDDLLAGDYIVRIPSSEFVGSGDLRDYRSSTGGGSEPAPDADTPPLTDFDDNGTETGGILGLGGYIQTEPFTLTPGDEQSTDDSTGLTSEFRVDFGVFNGPQVDLAITKDDLQTYYITNSTLTYSIVVTNNGPADVSGAVVSDSMPPQIDSWTWTCVAAVYGCTGGSAAPFIDAIDLPIGESITYNVVAQVSSTATLDLVNTVEVTAPGYEETDTDNNSATDTDQPASVVVDKDDHISIVAPDTLITYHIEITNNGDVDLADLVVTDSFPPDDVTFVRVYQGTPPTETEVTTTSPAVDKRTWGPVNLASGDSISFYVEVRVNATPTNSSITNEVTVTDSVTHATDSDNDTDNITTTNVKVLSSTNEADSGNATPADPEPVFIGEILTYTIAIDVPAGTMYNLKALDVMDSGLAFVQCVDIDPGPPTTTLTTDLIGGFPAACNIILPSTNPLVSAFPVGNLESINQGSQILFDLGNVSSTSNEILTITYKAIVLDVAANGNGVGNLNNHVDWTWNTNSSLSSEATPVTIDEPALTITKTALPTTAMYGTPITFTLDVSHAIASTAPAYDVILKDVLPAGLTYIPTSAVSTGLAPDSTTYDPSTFTLMFVWYVFPLAETSSITFQATFIGPSPVQNEASLEWTSIEIDPTTGGTPAVLSDHNIHSTERWYDPLDQTVNDYGVRSDVRIRTPEDILPLTGFKPGVQTMIPLQPEQKAYDEMEAMWLEIPKLKVNIPITGVPYVDETWDLTWLSDQAGYLAGSTFPGQVGNTAITAHVVLADGTPGPFVKLDKLGWGDQIILHINGEKFVYEVRQAVQALPTDYSMFRYDGYTWVTLITCSGYNEYSETYTGRTMVKAVLISTELE